MYIILRTRISNQLTRSVQFHDFSGRKSMDLGPEIDGFTQKSGKKWWFWSVYPGKNHGKNDGFEKMMGKMMVKHCQTLDFLLSPSRACAASMHYEARRCEAPAPGGGDWRDRTRYGSKSKTFLCYGCNQWINGCCFSWIQLNSWLSKLSHCLSDYPLVNCYITMVVITMFHG